MHMDVIASTKTRAINITGYYLTHSVPFYERLRKQKFFLKIIFRDDMQKAWRIQERYKKRAEFGGAYR